MKNHLNLLIKTDFRISNIIIGDAECIKEDKICIQVKTISFNCKINSNEWKGKYWYYYNWFVYYKLIVDT